MLNRRGFLRALIAVPAAMTVAGRIKFPAPNPYAKAMIPAKTLYGRIAISGEVIKHSSPAAFLQALDLELASLKLDMMQAYNEELRNA